MKNLTNSIKNYFRISYVSKNTKNFAKQTFGLELEKFPTMIILTPDNRIFPYPEDKETSSYIVRSWLNDVFTGALDKD